MIAHIVAAAENGVIGVEGQLPWDIPEDMKFFRDTTKGHPMIMGRKTFESVGHPLPNRLNVIVTRQKDYKVDGAHVVSSIEEGIEFCRSQEKQWGSDIFIIGGGEIYKQSMSLVDTIYLTKIHKTIVGDAYYPTVDENSFDLVDRKDRDKPVPFSFLTFKRRSYTQSD